ncbi:MAG TPA: hypothetical protein VMU65_00685 [Candidatus Saccharimonadales bacterium]|nr:hypothetical protein [Candidatus Saccharimonadales bacterium]
MIRLRPGTRRLRIGMAVASSLLVLTACGGPASQAIPTPASGGLIGAPPHLSGSPKPTASTAAANPKATIAVKGVKTPSPARATSHGDAPVPVTALTKIGGCQVFPPNNPWNEKVSKLPVNPNSAAYIASIDSTKQFLHPDFGSNPTYGIPYTVVPRSQPFVPITFNAYGDESNPGPYPVPLNAPVESGSDRHVLVVDSGNCHLYEMYDAQRAGGGWECASGAVFNLNSNALRPEGWTSADAAGLPILPGLALYSEVAAGAIDHALRFTVQDSQNGWISPATHQAGSANTALPPMGLRLRLKASFSLAGFHGEALVILTALKTYGMMVADNGSSWYVSGDTDPRWNDNDLNQLKTVPGNAFEAVETGPIQH